MWGRCEPHLEGLAVLCAVVSVLAVRAHQQQQVVRPELPLIGHRSPVGPGLLIHAVQADARLQSTGTNIRAGRQLKVRGGAPPSAGHSRSLDGRKRGGGPCLVDLLQVQVGIEVVARMA